MSLLLDHKPNPSTPALGRQFGQRRLRGVQAAAVPADRRLVLGHLRLELVGPRQ